MMRMQLGSIVFAFEKENSSNCSIDLYCNFEWFFVCNVGQKLLWFRLELWFRSFSLKTYLESQLRDRDYCKGEERGGSFEWRGENKNIKYCSILLEIQSIVIGCLGI